jgi:predicted Zn-dependent peptidase
VKAFFKTYYAPNDAALAIMGDFDREQAKSMVMKYFGGIPSAKVPSSLSPEPNQEKEKMATRIDALASRPALGFAYHMPQRNSPEHFAMGLIDQLLVQVDAAFFIASRQKARLHGPSGWQHQRIGQHVQLQGAHHALDRISHTRCQCQASRYSFRHRQGD